MLSSFWRSHDRFSLGELRRLIDQLQRVHVVNEVNKDFVIEALRSIAELITYGDQHDSAFFEYFMEKQVMGEFVRILKISRTVAVSLQLLQTMSIMIQNLKSEHSIYYLFSNGHINFLISYKFDFCNEELLSYYISFLRAISGNLNRNTISLLVKTDDEDVVSFPLYVEAIRFAFHEENMIRTAIRALTLNVYHVGDESVNRFITMAPQSNYFSDLVTFFRKQCLDLDGLVLENTVRSTYLNASSTILEAVDEIEDNLYYFSDAISAGIPDLGRLMTECILQSIILPILLPSLWSDAMHEQISARTSLYLLCCILRIVKIKDLANTTAAALFCRPEAFLPIFKKKVNGYDSDHVSTPECQPVLNDESTESINHYSNRVLRDELLSFIIDGDDHQVTGSLNVLATLLQTKELDETMLDALGILPQRKQHKKVLLKALVGEGSGEEQLFSFKSGTLGDGFSSELDGYLQKLKDQYGLACSSPELGTSPRAHRFQVLDALVSLFCRSNISAETLWDGGWLLRQLLPYTEAEFDSHHFDLLNDTYRKRSRALLEEIMGDWVDLLIPVVCDEWKKCKQVIEASVPRKEPKSLLLPFHNSSFRVLGDSSYYSGEKMHELVKVFVLLCQLQFFSLGKDLLEHPPINPPVLHENCRAITANLDASGPKPGAEIKLVDAVPCRISFERGREGNFLFIASSVGSCGWIILAEELPSKQQHGIVRVAAPLAGSNPRIDDKHAKWLHLRIRPSTLPFFSPFKTFGLGRMKPKPMIDGRWTLAFKDEESCRSALSMITEQLNLQRAEVERRLKPLVMLEEDPNTSKNSDHLSETSYSLNASLHLTDASSSNETPAST